MRPKFYGGKDFKDVEGGKQREMVKQIKRRESLGAETAQEWRGSCSLSSPLSAQETPTLSLLSPLTNQLIGWTAKVHWSTTYFHYVEQ
jgi:hypothetical protein